MLSFFAQQEQITAKLSLVEAGNMKIRDNDKDEVVMNQKAFLSSIGVAYDDFHFAQVVHGTEVGHATQDSPRIVSGVDGLIATEPGVYVGLTVADCFPVFFYDHVAGNVAVAHAGWRGTVKGIIPRTIAALEAAGSLAQNIHIELGPGISQANFEFHYAEMIEEFGMYNQDKYIARGSSLDKIYIDLQAILMDQVERAGVPIKNMKYCGDCTFADEKFFSARRHQGDSHSAMLAVIGFKK